MAEWSQVLSALAILCHSDHRKKVVKSNGLPNDAGSKVGEERGGWGLYIAGALLGLLQDTNTEGWVWPGKKQPCDTALGGFFRILPQGSQLLCGCTQSIPTAVQDGSEFYFPQSMFMSGVALTVEVGAIEEEKPLPWAHPPTILLPLKSSLSHLCGFLPPSQVLKDFIFFPLCDANVAMV